MTLISAWWLSTARGGSPSLTAQWKQFLVCQKKNSWQTVLRGVRQFDLRRRLPAAADNGNRKIRHEQGAQCNHCRRGAHAGEHHDRPDAQQKRGGYGLLRHHTGFKHGRRNVQSAPAVLGMAENRHNAVAIEKIRKEADQQFNFHGIISRSNEMRHIFSLLPRIAESDSTILIEGPSGSGKELIAQTIHRLSHRKHKPMITVNSGALPDTLLESELFGYKAGAFTDAKKDKPGRIALAEGGTLFLDEIGDISPALQVKLLRFLQNREYEPLGSTEQLRADVRILAATHRNLASWSSRGNSGKTCTTESMFTP